MIASLLFVFTAAAEISTSCGLNLFLNLQPKFTRNCYMTTTELLKIPDNLASTSPQTFYKLCLESCQETIKTASSLISTPSCASSTFDDDGKINGSIVSNFLQLAPAACLRTSDGNGFCLQSQLPVLLPILETITDSLSVVRILFGKRNEVCNDCVKRELDATKGIDLIYLDEKVRRGIDLFRDNFQFVCPFGLETIKADPFEIPELVEPVIGGGGDNGTQVLLPNPSKSTGFSPSSCSVSMLMLLTVMFI